ncbi:MAG: hypothetical protein AB4290_16895 [Spirulina sp.]
MIIYHYHPQTQQFLGEGQADRDPLQSGNFLIPAHATPIAPPEIPDGKRAIFKSESRKWILEDIPTVPQPDTDPSIQIDRIIENWKAFIRDIRQPILRPIQDAIASQSFALANEIRDAWKIPPIEPEVLEDQRELWNESLVYPSVIAACEVEISGISRLALFAQKLDEFNIPLEIDPVTYELRIIPE